MRNSFTYYLTLIILQLKGIKKSFSVSPIDYLKLRENDIYSPKGKFYQTNTISTFSILDSKITHVKIHESDKLILFFHGGGFVAGPGQHHRDFIEFLSKKTNFNIWMCNYPKAPENKIDQIALNIDEIYNEAIKHYNSENIFLMGDSAGGTLAIALTQRLIMKKIKIPSKLLLISPVLDASLKNTAIDKMDKKDKMLSKIGVLSAKSMCSDNLNDHRISPINGEFQNFPKTYLFIAEHDITFPDQLIFAEKLNSENVEKQVIIGTKMPHIWLLLPIMKEAKVARNQIIDCLNE